MNATRLKYSELKRYREHELNKDDACPLCGDTITSLASALDHDHSSGRVRRVLHPECNILLGKIENFLKRWSRGLSKDERISNFFDNVYSYMDADYSHNPLHPKHLTSTDKLMRKHKRLLRVSKRRETKEKYRVLIAKLKEELS